jgi:putative two-component system response regulator
VRDSSLAGELAPARTEAARVLTAGTRTGVDETAVEKAPILIVDDSEANLRLLETLLGVSRFTNVVTTTESSDAVALCGEVEPDLLVLDLQMPPPDGFEVMAMLAPWIHGSPRLPVLVITGDNERETKERALSAGASDFLNKPFDPSEVVLRVRNLVLTRLLQVELHEQNRQLEQRVRERTRDLEEARAELVDRLALAAEYRDDATGEHPQRVGRVAALIARELGLPDDTVDLIRRAAPLHDVGNLGIPDSILLKQESLTPVEFEAMKLHVAIGSEILGRSRSRLLQMSEEIARTHHERWDGSGYPAGLRGEAIPITGRIVAVADAFDRLTHKRPYRGGRSQEEAAAELRQASGREFDPQVVEALLARCSELASTAPEPAFVS